MTDTPLNRTFTNLLDTSGTLRARAPKGLRASLKGVACLVAIASGISMPAEAKCHHEIIYRESRWNPRAIGNIGGTKQAYGLYQMKVESLKKGSTVKQFWMYWTYVSHRYGHTQYDEPDYCAALNHLKIKGWQ